MIYLDNAATTQPTEAVLQAYQKAQHQLFYNSESLHIGGEQVRATLRHAREWIQHHFQVKKEVLFGTSGSDVNEMAIRLYLERLTEGTIWVSPYEHPSIFAALEPYQTLFQIKMMPMNDEGALDIRTLRDQLTDDTVLIIAQHVNSETGYILPVDKLGVMAQQRQIPFHIDGVQAVQKIDVKEIVGCTSYTFSGHKFHGTKGCGVLMVNYEMLYPLNTHFFHEQGLRNGTMDVPSILALVQALSTSNQSTEMLHHCYHHAWKRATALGCIPLSSNEQAPHILGLLIPKFEGQYMMQMLSNRNICISTGTACGHGIILSAGLTKKITGVKGEVHQYIRVSFSSYTTTQEIDQCFDTMAHIIHEGGFE